MTREEAIRELKIFSGTTRIRLSANFWEALNTVIEALEQEQRWIPCSERLPKKSLNSVIGWDAYRERCVFVQYIDGHFQITGRNESFNITAWMPLPDDYKEGVEE